MKPLAEVNLIQLIGLTLECISYGIYCMIFTAYLRIRLRKTGSQNVFFYLLTVNFIMCTAHLVLSVAQDQLSQFQTIWLPRLAISHDALYISIDFLTQVILTYRCWIMWRRPLIMVVPIVLSLGFLVISVTATVGLAIFPGFSQGGVPDWYFAAVVSYFSVSLAVNALVAGLIIFKILTVYRKSQGLKSYTAYVDTRGRDLLPIISILIESGVVTFVAQLVQATMYKLSTDAFPVVAGLVIMIYGISTTIVLVRVEWSHSLNVDNETSKTVIRFAPSESDNDTATTISTFNDV